MSDQSINEVERMDWAFAKILISMTLLAAAWGGLVAEGAYLLAVVVGLPVGLAWAVLLKERGFGG